MNPVPAAILLALASSSALADPRPVRPLVPGPADRELKIPTLGPALPEGTFISAARGQLAKGASGHLYFIFDADAQNRRLPGVVLLPSEHLPAVERLAAQLGPAGRMDITGRIFSYAGLNYLFVSAPPISASSPANEPPAAPTPAPTEPKPEAPAPTPTPMPAPAADVQQPLSPDPTIDEIVADLDRAVGRRRDTRSAAPATTPEPTPASPTADAPAAPIAPAAAPVDDALLTGAVLVSRRGRLVRTPEGLLAFTPDAGAGAPTAGPGVTGSQPLILLPSRALESLESLAESAGERATYTLSGQITVYNSRAYLLPTFVTTNRATDIVLPTQ